MIEPIVLLRPALAFFIAVVAVRALRPLAPRLGLIDHPQGRKDHAAPTPVTGGIALFVGALAGFAAGDMTSPALQAFWMGAALLLVVGIIDDALDLRWYWRILAQVSAALILVYWGQTSIEQLRPILGLQHVGLGGFSVPLTVFVTVGVINALNMIDGVDGLAGSLALAALAMFAAAAWYAGNEALAYRSVIMAAAVAGFLFWNLRMPWRPRAQVFMGDAGSMVLGFFIAWVSFRLTQNPGHPVSPVLAPWLLVIPVMDTVVLIVRRLRQGRSPFSAGRDHIHHLLRDAGYSPTAMCVLLVAVSLTAGLVAAQCMRWDVPQPLFVLAFVVLCVGWYAFTTDRARAVRVLAALRGGRPVVTDVPEGG